MMRPYVVLLVLLLAASPSFGEKPTVLTGKTMRQAEMNFACIFCGKENRRPGDVYAFSFVLETEGKPEHFTAHRDCYEAFVSRADTILESAKLDAKARAEFTIPLRVLLSLVKHAPRAEP